MPSLWFVCPAHGRAQLARICLTQLARTCDQLEHDGIDARAVVVACDENLDTARDLGFATVERDNRFVSRRFNDGIQLATDPRYNPHPADYVVPIGSDDWVDHQLFLDLPPADTIVGFQRLSFVREDGAEIQTVHLTNPAGSGIRIIPRQLLAPVGYRPADEARYRACDTSILLNLSQANRYLKIEHRHLHDRQIVDWKSYGENLNAYHDLSRHKRTDLADPFDVLQGVYPDEALEQMAAHYSRVAVAA